MSQELLYTSAHRGLKPGSRGFCTVVSTQGMATNLADRLESLSGYRHVYSPQDAQARFNPVVYSHLRLTVGGRRCHVLSRIADAGLDYSQRTNKIAHHVVLDVAELSPAGPALLLASPGFMETQWDNQVRIIPAGRSVPPLECQATVCTAWQRQTGDAGWGGVLAETAMDRSNRIVYLIFRPGMDLLPLLTESLALLPSSIRWNVSFSTYFTRLPAGVDCQWRCVVEGSPEAVSARRSPQTLMIDLTQPLGPATNGSYAEAARTGVVPSQPAARPATGAVMADDRQLEQVLRESAGGSADTYALLAESDPFALAPPPLSAGPVPPHIRMGMGAKRKRVWPWIVLGATAAVLLIAFVTTALWIIMRAEPRLTGEAVAVSVAEPTGESASLGERAEGTDRSVGGSSADKEEPRSSKTADTSSTVEEPKAPSSDAPAKDSTARTGESDLPQPRETSSSKSRGEALATPSVPEEKGTNSQAIPETTQVPSTAAETPHNDPGKPTPNQPLTKLSSPLDALPKFLDLASATKDKGKRQKILPGDFSRVAQETECDLDSNESVFPGGCSCKMKPLVRPADQVEYQFNLNCSAQSIPIAVLEFSARGIHFTWEDTSPQAGHLINCVLIFSETDSSAKKHVQLRAIREEEPFSIGSLVNNSKHEELRTLAELSTLPLMIEPLTPKGGKLLLASEKDPKTTHSYFLKFRAQESSALHAEFKLEFRPTKKPPEIVAKYHGIKDGLQPSKKLTTKDAESNVKRAKEAVAAAKTDVTVAQKAVDQSATGDEKNMREQLRKATELRKEKELELTEATSIERLVNLLADTTLPYRVYFKLPHSEVTLVEAQEPDSSDGTQTSGKKKQ